MILKRSETNEIREEKILTVAVELAPLFQLPVAAAGNGKKKKR